MYNLLGGLALLAATAASPPWSLHLDPFYAQYLDAGGIPVVASARAPDEALAVARDLVNEMLATRPDLRASLVRHGQRVAVMAEDETTTDLPEQRDWRKPAPDDVRLTRCERTHYDERIGRLTDRQYWDARARGMAGLLTSGGAEDLLGSPTSRYAGQNIFVHEFAHDLLDAIQEADPALYRRVAAAYAHAMRIGLWRGEYASTTMTEYWAVGTQFWFDDAPVARFGGRTVLNDDDLAAYDPALAAALRAAYGERHHLSADRWWRSPKRVPPGPLPANTAEVC